MRTVLQLSKSNQIVHVVLSCNVPTDAGMSNGGFKPPRSSLSENFAEETAQVKHHQLLHLGGVQQREAHVPVSAAAVSLAGALPVMSAPGGNSGSSHNNNNNNGSRHLLQTHHRASSGNGGMSNVWSHVTNIQPRHHQLVQQQQQQYREPAAGKTGAPHRILENHTSSGM